MPQWLSSGFSGRQVCLGRQSVFRVDQTFERRLRRGRDRLIVAGSVSTCRYRILLKNSFALARFCSSGKSTFTIAPGSTIAIQVRVRVPLNSIKNQPTQSFSTESPISCRSRRRQSPPKAASWQHVVCVLPANCRPSTSPHSCHLNDRCNSEPAGMPIQTTRPLLPVTPLPVNFGCVPNPAIVRN